MVAQKQNLLLIEDDPAFAHAVTAAFEPQFRVSVAGSAEEGIKLAEMEKPDLILLDIMLPVMDGIAACRELKSRADTADIPVIIVTSREDDERRSEALLAGADDLVSKPLRPKELLLRIQARLRARTAAAGSNSRHGVLSCGNLKLDLDKLEVRIGGRSIRLTSTDMRLLRFFMLSKGNVMSRQSLLDAVWPDKSVNDRVVDNRILALRKKLRGFNHNFITVYGVGYCLREKRG